MRTATIHSTSHRSWILFCTGLFAAGLVAALRWMMLASDAGHAPTPPAAAPIAAGEVLMAAARTDAAALQRDDAAPTGIAAAEPPSFERQIDHLAALQQQVTAAVQDDEHDCALAADSEARRAFAALLQQFPDAGERGLAMLVGLPPKPQELDRGRHVVLQHVLAAECARRHAAAEAARDRKHLDALVAALLAAMPGGEHVAALGEAVLAGHPFLRLVHEPAVLDLARCAGEGRLPRHTATRLLLTLWDNVRRSGERSPGEFAGQALLLLTDADPSVRTAACSHLLGDPGQRATVLAWLRERPDAAVATEVAALAAQQLPPAEALAALRELAPVLRDMPAAYLALGQRAPDVLADAYHELLAADTHPAVRADLVAGLAMTRTPVSAAAVELALQSDPSPEVRMQAMLSTTATLAPERGEAACHTILDDPDLGSDPARLAVVVFALQNLEAAGLTNAVDRLGKGLRNTPLRDDTRQALELLLARALPNGRTSR